MLRSRKYNISPGYSDYLERVPEWTSRLLERLLKLKRLPAVAASVTVYGCEGSIIKAERKLKGVVYVRLIDGSVRLAEIHWYEAHGIGKREFKLKLPFLD